MFVKDVVPKFKQPESRLTLTTGSGETITRKLTKAEQKKLEKRKTDEERAAQKKAEFEQLRRIIDKTKQKKEIIETPAVITEREEQLPAEIPKEIVETIKETKEIQKEVERKTGKKIPRPASDKGKLKEQRSKLLDEIENKAKRLKFGNVNLNQEQMNVLLKEGLESLKTLKKLFEYSKDPEHRREVNRKATSLQRNLFWIMAKYFQERSVELSDNVFNKSGKAIDEIESGKTKEAVNTVEELQQDVADNTTEMNTKIKEYKPFVPRALRILDHMNVGQVSIGAIY